MKYIVQIIEYVDNCTRIDDNYEFKTKQEALDFEKNCNRKYDSNNTDHWGMYVNYIGKY